jgi:hypothetical protein
MEGYDVQTAIHGNPFTWTLDLTHATLITYFF